MELQKKAEEEVSGNKRDKNGLIFGVDSIPLSPRPSQGSQGQQIHDSLTNQIFTNDQVLKKKMMEKRTVETLLAEGSKQQDAPENIIPAVKWSQSVVNKQSRASSQNGFTHEIPNFDFKELSIKLSDLNNKNKKPDIKSTTEINIIMQERLGHASVDELISRRDLTTASIAKQLLEESKQKQEQENKKTINQLVQKGSKLLPKSKFIRRNTIKEEPKIESTSSSKQTVTPKNNNIANEFKGNVQKVMAMQSVSKVMAMQTMQQAMNKSSLKKRPQLNPKDVHQGLFEMENKLKYQSQKLTPGYKHAQLEQTSQTLFMLDERNAVDLAYGKQGTFLTTQSEKKSDSISKESTLKSWQTSSRALQKINQQDSYSLKQREKLMAKNAIFAQGNLTKIIPKHDRTLTVSLPKIVHKKEIEFGQQNLPMESKILSRNSQTYSRNPSYKDIATEDREYIINLNRQEPLNTSKTRRTDTYQSLSKRSSQNVMSTMNRSKSIEAVDTILITQSDKKSLRPIPSQFKSEKKPIDEPMSQAVLFAKFAGLDLVTNAQDKDERHGRVVRDYKMLQENKDRMRYLIELIAQDTEEVGDLKKKKNIEKLRIALPESGKTTQLILESIGTPRSNLILQEIQPQSLLNNSVDFLNPSKKDKAFQLPQVNNQNQSITMASSVQQNMPQCFTNNLTSIYKQKLSPLDLSEDFSGDDQLQLIQDREDAKTTLIHPNFKYFLIQPHLNFGGKTKLKNKNALLRNQERQSGDTWSAFEIPQKNLDNRKGQSLDQSRPTSFDGQRQRKKLFGNTENKIDSLERKNIDQVSENNNRLGASSPYLEDGYLARQRYISNVDVENTAELGNGADEEYFQSVWDLNQQNNLSEQQRQQNNSVFKLSDKLKPHYAMNSIDVNGHISQSDQYTIEDGSGRNAQKKTQSPSSKKNQLIEVKARVDTHHGQRGKMVGGTVNYYNPLTYVLEKGKVKSTMKYIIQKLDPYAEPVLQHIQRQQHQTAMSIQEHPSRRDQKTNKIIISSPFKKTPSKEALLPASLLKQTPKSDRDYNDRNTSSHKKKRLLYVNQNGQQIKTSNLERTLSPKNENQVKKKRKTKKKQNITKKLNVEPVLDKVKIGGNDSQDEAIMEMSEEYNSAQSEENLEQADDPNKDQNWQEIFEENQQLKVQIASQIAIFEQYLKVAMLQQQQRDIQMRRQEKRLEKGIFEGMEVIYDKTKPGEEQNEKTLVLQTENNKDYENKKEMNKEQRLKQRAEQSEKRFLNQAKRSSQDKPLTETSFSENQQVRIEQRSGSKQSKKMSSQRKKSAKRRSLSISTEYNEETTDKQLTKNQSLKLLKGLQTNDNVRGYRKKSQLAPQFMRQVNALSPKTLIMPKLGIYGYNLQHDAHTAHQIWLDRIEVLWGKLEYCRDSDCVRAEITIEHNRKRIYELTRDNIFELEVQTNDQKMLLRAKFNAQKMKQALKETKEERKIRKIQKKLRSAIRKSEELHSWGLGNYVIELKIKCRMNEEIIDLAQRLLLRPDRELQTKMQKLKMLREQTYDDLRYFIIEREKVHWRNWDHMFMGNWKPEIAPSKKNLLVFFTEKCDLTLMQIEFLELQSLYLSSDINGFNQINAESIQTVTEKFGHDHWLHFWTIQQLRKKQSKRLYAQDPSKELLSALKDPVKHELYYQTLRLQKNFSDGLKDLNGRKRAQFGTNSTLNLEIQRIISAEDLESPDQNKAIKAVKFQEDTPLAFKVAHGVHVMSLSADEADSPRNQDEAKKAPFDQDQRSNTGAKDFMTVIESESPDLKNHLDDGQENNQDYNKLQTLQPVQEEVNESKPRVSKWLQQIKKSKKDKEERDRKEREARVARLQQLFDEDDDDHGIADRLDKHAVEQKMQDYLSKIDTHLKVELQLLNAWQNKPENQVNSLESQQQ